VGGRVVGHTCGCPLEKLGLQASLTCFQVRLLHCCTAAQWAGLLRSCCTGPFRLAHSQSSQPTDGKAACRPHVRAPARGWLSRTNSTAVAWTEEARQAGCYLEDENMDARHVLRAETARARAAGGVDGWMVQCLAGSDACGMCAAGEQHRRVGTMAMNARAGSLVFCPLTIVDCQTARLPAAARRGKQSPAVGCGQAALE
jgi:hypothetical protein